MSSVSCGSILHEVTVKPFVHTRLIEKWTEYEVCISLCVDCFLKKKMEPISFRLLIAHNTYIFYVM